MVKKHRNLERRTLVKLLLEASPATRLNPCNFSKVGDYCFSLQTLLFLLIFGTCMYDFCVLEVMDDMRLSNGVIWTDLCGKELV